MKLTLKHKVIGLALSAALLPVVVMSLFIWLEKSRIHAVVRERVETLIRDKTDQIAKDVYALCESANALIQRQVDSNLRVARMILAKKGELTFDAEKTPWTAVNQLTQTEIEVELPKALVEGKWLGQNVDGKKQTPVVDEVRDTVGGTCTIFQRMNKQGDMLRIATNVLGHDGKRAIGTYIPAQSPDGTADPVVAAILKGETYHGPALVVDTWYLTAYEPILDAKGIVAGMLYVGVKRDAVASVREAIQSIKVGKTGYVAVYGAKGEHRGRYVVAKRGTQLEQTDIVNSTNEDGRLFIQEIITSALQLPKGSVAYDEYDWRLPGESASRTKLVAYTYFEPWDWIISPGTYRDDYENDWLVVESSLQRLLWYSVGVALILACLMIGVAILIGGRIADPIGRITAVAQIIASGDLHAAAEALKSLSGTPQAAAAGGPAGAPCGSDETGRLFAAIDTMTRSLSSLVGQVQYSGIQVTSSATEIAASAKELEATAAEQAASTTEVVTSAQEISATSRGLANTMEEVTAMASGTATLAAAGRQQLGDMETSMQQLADATCTISSRLSAINEKANNISNVATTINKVADQTNLLSLNAAIEAEKAGEDGRGFSVVAREIRRLADQAAVATLEIDEIVKEMQTAVSAGVMEMDKFSAHVRHSVDEMAQISVQQSQVIEQVQALEPRFERINEGMQQQSQMALQISESMIQLNAAARQTAAALSEFNQVTEQLNSAARGLQGEVSRFKVNS
jgi:methyl-accepting chemotaxis protein WspA